MEESFKQGKTAIQFKKNVLIRCWISTRVKKELHKNTSMHESISFIQILRWTIRANSYNNS